MKLISLSLSQFRQHETLEVSFPSGVIGIIGRNGSGKSTLIEAITFALYGSKAIRGKLDEVRTHSVDSGSVVATLQFEQDATWYRVERTLNDAKFYVGGGPKPLVKGGRDVTEKIQQIIGMTYEEFIATFYTEQKGLEFLSQKKGGAERERFIMRMMGYDRVERVQEKVRLDRRDIKNQLLGLEQGVLNEEDLKAEGAGLEVEYAAITDELTRLSQSLAEKVQEAEVLKQRYERVAAEREGYLALAHDLKRAEAVSDERKKSWEKVKTSSESLQLESQRLAALLPSTTTHFEEALQKVELALSALHDELKSEEEVWTKEKTKVETLHSAAKRELVALADKLQRIASLSSTNEPCPTCGQALGIEVHGAIEHLEAEKVLLQQKTERLHDDEKKLSAIPVPLKILKQKQHDLLLEREALVPFIETANKLSTTKRELDKSRSAEAELKASLNEVERSISSLQAKLNASGYSEDRFASEKARYETQQSLISTARLERVKREGDAEKIKGKIDQILSMVERIQSQSQQREVAREQLIILSQCDDLLTDFRRHLVTSLRPKLSILAGEFLFDLTDGRYGAVELTEDFTPHIFDGGEIQPVISGGEEDILHISVRLALSQLLAERSGREFSLLILDEVFGSLDETRRSNLLSLLSKLTTRFEQVMIISHFDDVKDAVDSVIAVDHDEISGKTRVQQHAAIQFFAEDAVNL